MVDKGSSAVGPAIVGAIVDRIGTIRPAFVFLLFLYPNYLGIAAYTMLGWRTMRTTVSANRKQQRVFCTTALAVELCDLGPQPCPKPQQRVTLFRVLLHTLEYICS